ncbi:MAG: flagellar type III secretion system pore protein FliP [Vibrionaceae bacterium]
MIIKIQSVIAALVLWLWCAPLFAQVSEVPQAAQSMLAQSAPGASMLQIKNGNAGIPAFNMTVNPDGSEDYSITLQILAVMTALGFLPAIVILMTSFTRIVVVMAILRQALGLQQTPSNQIIVGIAMFLTFFIMSPVIEKMNSDALTPYLSESISAKEAFARVQLPLREFMLRQTRLTDLETFVNMSGAQVSEPEQVPITVLIPAFITSELKTAFQIGFMLFLPFLIIDLVVASVLMAMGMMMLSPMIVSLPFKLMLFVLVDGWNLILSTLAGSFG